MGKFSEEFKIEKFQKLLVVELVKFVPDHMDAVMGNSELNYGTYGSDREVKLKKLILFLGNLQRVFEDLDLTFLFLRKERNLILEHYPELEDYGTYYGYHFENFYIRIITVGDILKKISSKLFNSIPTPEEFPVIVKIWNQIEEELKKFKNSRHEKVHDGDSNLQTFSGIVSLEDSLRAFKLEVDDEMKKATDYIISERIKELESYTLDLIKLLENFFLECVPNLQELIDSEN